MAFADPRGPRSTASREHWRLRRSPDFEPTLGESRRCGERIDSEMEIGLDEIFGGERRGAAGCAGVIAPPEGPCRAIPERFFKWRFERACRSVPGEHGVGGSDCSLGGDPG